MGDYAACTGTTGFDYTVHLPHGPSLPPTGAFEAVTGIRFAAITDGLSNTILVGEKHVPRGSEGLPPWDCGIYDGHNPACLTRAAGPGFALGVLGSDSGWKLGSRHPGICQFVFADGSVQALPSSVNPRTLGLLAHRSDGQVIPPY